MSEVKASILIGIRDGRVEVTIADQSTVYAHAALSVSMARFVAGQIYAGADALDPPKRDLCSSNPATTLIATSQTRDGPSAGQDGGDAGEGKSQRSESQQSLSATMQNEEG